MLPQLIAVLEPVLLPKVWGGDALRRWHLPVPAGATIGEAWMTADVRETAVSGAGGGAVQSPLTGTAGTLADLLNADPAHWLGDAAPRAVDGFPLLVKLLDAREHLSVQVHPAPHAAAPGERVKHECWLVLDAMPGAELFLGLQDGVDGPALAAAATDGSLPSLLRRVPAVVGECHLLPSGMVHALGAGCVVAEVQTASDTTFRLYDWTREYARPPRELHLARALTACDGTLKPITHRFPASGPGIIAETSAFRCEGLVLTETTHLHAHASTAGALVILPLDGEVEVRCGSESASVSTGRSAVVAAARPGPVSLRAKAARLLLAEARSTLA